MDFTHHTHPDRLELYSFYWSEARLLIASLALFLGGVPPVILILPLPLTGLILTLCWIISGIVSGYLVYRWHKAGMKLFGEKNTLDTAAFAVNVVSGFNLGVAGLLGINIGMTISSNYILFVIVGVLYLASAIRLGRRWQVWGRKLFSTTTSAL